MENQANHYEDEIIIDIGAMCQALLKKIHIIMLAGILCASAAFGVSKFMMTPKYDSTTKILVISRQNETTLTYADLQIGTVLTGDYVELVTSRNVLEEVISELHLDMTVGELKSCLTVEPVEDTRIVSITARHEDPAMAKSIVDTLRETVGRKFANVTSIESTYTVEDANMPTQPASPSVFKYTVLGGLFGVALVAGIIIVRFLLDDSIKSQSDVEMYLDMNVLALIPMEENSRSGNVARNPKKQRRQTSKKR